MKVGDIILYQPTIDLVIIDELITENYVLITNLYENTQFICKNETLRPLTKKQIFGYLERLREYVITKNDTQQCIIKNNWAKYNNVKDIVEGVAQ